MPQTTPPCALRSHALSDVGRVRAHNEDFFLLLPEARLFLLADGMGGHNAGEVASRVALEAVRDFILESAGAAAGKAAQLRGGSPAGNPASAARPELPAEADRLRLALRFANSRVLEEAKRSKERQGMGTTCVALYLWDQTAAVAHMGDSRAYRLRGAALTQLTEDHSLVQEQVRMGLLTPAQASLSPHKNVITRACGIREDALPDVRTLDVRPGDVYLLCSDGLSNLVSEKKIAEILSHNRSDLTAACGSLVAAANVAGGDDNVTVVVVAADVL